jgi:tRNA threonylcarbamoyladenosine biosynthesis protein TsaE
MMSQTRLSTSEADTAAAGRELGRTLRTGDVVVLDGPLGAGKTAFVRGLAAGLGCDPSDVSSPTFTVIQEYAGPTTLQHVDLYRLTPAEVEELGLDELMDEAVLAVEWPDRWQRRPTGAAHVQIEVVDAETRRLTITPASPYSTR